MNRLLSIVRLTSWLKPLMNLQRKYISLGCQTGQEKRNIRHPRRSVCPLPKHSLTPWGYDSLSCKLPQHSPDSLLFFQIKISFPCCVILLFLLLWKVTLPFLWVRASRQSHLIDLQRLLHGCGRGQSASPPQETLKLCVLMSVRTTLAYIPRSFYQWGKSFLVR